MFMFVVTAKRLTFVGKDGKAHRLSRSKLPKGNPYHRPASKRDASKALAAEIGALKIEGGHK